MNPVYSGRIVCRKYLCRALITIKTTFAEGLKLVQRSRRWTDRQFLRFWLPNIIFGGNLKTQISQLIRNTCALIRWLISFYILNILIILFLSKWLYA